MSIRTEDGRGGEVVGCILVVGLEWSVLGVIGIVGASLIGVVFWVCLWMNSSAVPMSTLASSSFAVRSSCSS